MAIREMELNLNFALASKLQAASFLEDEEVRKNIAHRLRDYLATLPADRECWQSFYQFDQTIRRANRMQVGVPRAPVRGVLAISTIRPPPSAISNHSAR